MTLSARARPPDLGRLVGAGHTLVEVAGGDGVGRALDVLERAQAQPDQPPACGEREHERAGSDGQLNEEERMQGAGLVDQRLRLHQHQPAGGLLGARTRKAGPPAAMDPAVK